MSKTQNCQQTFPALAVRCVSQSLLADWGVHTYGPEAKLSVSFLDTRRVSVQRVISDLLLR